MAIPSKQIGWSEESNLIWEIARELEKINQQLGAANPNLPTTPRGDLGLPSKQIGWGQETILLYEVLRQIKKIRYTLG